MTYPTLIPSSISVGETLSPNPTTNCMEQNISLEICVKLHG
jgi:hypothetical protein